ncbi:hypothetical protein A2U01_0100991, partial [Trifolium medium]|nr:hypothetical protein [Trifolium medium]
MVSYQARWATSSDRQRGGSEVVSLQRQKATESQQDPKIPGLSERKRQK